MTQGRKPWAVMSDPLGVEDGAMPVGSGPLRGQTSCRILGSIPTSGDTAPVPYPAGLATSQTGGIP
ncbi:MAG TPA: hypothetical protein VHS06_08875 [Chloroflexota bacterium]|nr:hypothetical protein [Chloroflexota bacterium]